MTAYHLTCVECASVYPAGFDGDVCPKHPGLEGILSVKYEWPSRQPAPAGPLDRPQDTLRRYADLLPLTAESLEHLPAGWLTPTPLIDAPTMAKTLGVSSLRIKDEGRNPTG